MARRSIGQDTLSHTASGHSTISGNGANTMTSTTSLPELAMDAPRRAAGHLFFRSVALPAFLAACILVLVLASFGFIAWRGLQHLDPIERHLTALTHLQETGLRLEELAGQEANQITLQQSRLVDLQRDLGNLIASDGFLAPKTQQRLVSARAALSDLGNDPERSLQRVIGQVRAALSGEFLAHGRLLAQVRHDLLLEFSVTGSALLVLTSLGVLIIIRMRRRVLAPLDTLQHLLSLLAKRDYSLAPTEGVDPIVRPLTLSYNDLVNRLIELEDESARYRDTLEQEVRTATEALLEQHRSLASAERLAAVGEVAARIAHELRNPLAGMQLALSNIRAECNDRSDIVERLDLVVDELRRVTGLLNGLLDQARITPEPAVDLPLAKTVDDLLAIVRYQIPKDIQLRTEIPEELVCHLPKDCVRQALLNLILNSAGAIGARSGEIVVAAAAVGDKLKLTVSDDGPGFPADWLTEGVSPFRTGRAGGIGLGLSIVMRLVRNLEGRIELRNRKPHGACVRLILPIRGTYA